MLLLYLISFLCFDSIFLPIRESKMQITPKFNTDKIKSNNDLIFDRDWLKTTFIIGDEEYLEGDIYSEFLKKNRYFSSADFKFTSTAPGLSIACNPKPQFTRYCDIRSMGKVNARKSLYLDDLIYSVGTTTNQNSLGLGRYYSEAIDDNEQRIYFRFGLPKYTPLLIWLRKSFDIDKVILQNRGFFTSTVIQTAGLISKLFAVAAAPLLSLGMFILGVIVDNSRFFHIGNGNMYLYWATVENILNQMVSRRTMLPQLFPDFTLKYDGIMNKEITISKQFIDELSSYIPDIIDPETGRISVFAIALRAQVAYHEMKMEDINAPDSENPSYNFTGFRESGDTVHTTPFRDKEGNIPFINRIFGYAYDFLMTNEKDAKEKENNTTSLISMDPSFLDPEGNIIEINNNPDDPNGTFEQKLLDNAIKNKSKFENYKKYLLAELGEGAAFAVFNVDSTGSVGESFSNSTTTNPLEVTFNSLSSKVRNITDFMSSVTSAPVIGDAIKLAGDTVATVLSNASLGIVNPLLALAYGTQISFPKIWESSSASLPRASYKFKLISPYGNAYSQLFNIYLPLSMILAGSLPRSTGASTYTHPFFCQLFDRGRVNIQLGIIENVSITRGTSNLAFSRSGKPNAIDISIDVANMDEIITVDVNSTGVLGKLSEALNLNFNINDNPFSSYVNTITGVDVYTQIYRIPQIRLKLAEKYMTLKAIVNPDPAAFAAFTVDKVPGAELVKQILRENAKAMEDLFYR